MAYSIDFNHVFKKYRLGRAANNRPVFWETKKHPEDQFHWAVKDVSFQLQPGESIGIIGPNGAGKTTILKLLSKVTFPTSGSIHVNGRFSALIELGAGFHPELSGRENIFLNGTILGMKRNEIKARFDQIVDFAGIGNYLDTPVKHYSSGMYARLGFAIAAHIDPDVLLVDEVLSVGDFAFQTKCHARMDQLRANGTSMVFISHNMEAIRRVCDRALVMYRGENIFEGPANEAVATYSRVVRDAARLNRQTIPLEQGLSQRVLSFDAEIVNTCLKDIHGNVTQAFTSGSDAILTMDIYFHKDVSQPIFAFYVRSPNGQIIYDTTTQWMKLQTGTFHAGERWQIEYTFHLPLLDGNYELGVNLAHQSLSHYFDRIDQALDFWIKGTEVAKGLVDLNAKFDIKQISKVQIM